MGPPKTMVCMCENCGNEAEMTIKWEEVVRLFFVGAGFLRPTNGPFYGWAGRPRPCRAQEGDFHSRGWPKIGHGRLACATKNPLMDGKVFLVPKLLLGNPLGGKAPALL